VTQANVETDADVATGRLAIMEAKRVGIAQAGPVAANVETNADTVAGQLRNVTAAVNNIPSTKTVTIKADIDPMLVRASPSPIEQVMEAIDRFGQRSHPLKIDFETGGDLTGGPGDIIPWLTGEAKDVRTHAEKLADYIKLTTRLAVEIAADAQRGDKTNEDAGKELLQGVAKGVRSDQEVLDDQVKASMRLAVERAADEARGTKTNEAAGKELINGVAEAVRSEQEVLDDAVKAAMRLAVERAAEDVRVAKPLGMTLMEGAVTGAEAEAEQLSRTVEQVTVDALKAAADGVRDAKPLEGAIRGGLRDAVVWAADDVETNGEAITDALNTLGDGAGSAVDDMVDRVSAGLKEMVRLIRTTKEEIAAIGLIGPVGGYTPYSPGGSTPLLPSGTFGSNLAPVVPGGNITQVINVAATVTNTEDAHVMAYKIMDIQRQMRQ
jgi:hypothetical protein